MTASIQRGSYVSVEHDARSRTVVTPPVTTVESLCERYETFLLDAYGVLVDGSGPLPGAVEMLGTLRDAGRTYMIVSNDAARLPEIAARRYRGMGLPITDDRILTSAALVAPFLEREGLGGRACIVLGPPATRALVETARGRVVSPDDRSAEILVVCDDAGYDFLPTVEQALSTAIHRIDRGDPIHLVLPNPDLSYPKAAGLVGVAAGSIAMMIEAALAQRFGRTAPRFVRLGKPHAPIFEAALQLLDQPSRERTVMVGDQLHTDVAGANEVGIDSVLIGTGVAAVHRDYSHGPRPTWLLPSL